MVSSGAIMPARAPASIDMLHTVMRPSIDRARMVVPAYSITCPAAPFAPTRAMMARITSFAVTPSGRAPSTAMRIVFERRCQVVCVASTWVISLAPAPKASAPSAPWVEVCESPHTITRPGCVMPCSGPTTCTMPWRGSSREKCTMPAARVLRASSCTTRRCSASAMASIRCTSVETPWSGVAKAWSGRRTFSPRSCRNSNACIEPSCTRWRPTCSSVWPPCPSTIACASQTFS